MRFTGYIALPYAPIYGIILLMLLLPARLTAQDTVYVDTTRSVFIAWEGPAAAVIDIDTHSIALDSGEFQYIHLAYDEDFPLSIRAAGQSHRFETPFSGRHGGGKILLDYAEGDFIVQYIYTYTESKRSHAMHQLLKRIDANMAYIPAGRFRMGLYGATAVHGHVEHNPWYYPSHWVRLDAYYISKYEFTRGDWCLALNKRPPKCPDCPATSKSWEEVVAFIDTLSKWSDDTYRLPTEAEWEYAARGGPRERPTRYAGSDELSAVAWSSRDSSTRVHEVGQLQPNELGLYDMSGNVHEWCTDWFGKYADYPETELTNPTGPVTGKHKVVRGGGYHGSIEDFQYSVAGRVLVGWGGMAAPHIGFRLLREAVR